MEPPETGERTPPGGVARSLPVPQPQRQREPAHVGVDDSKAVACYANFCRITGTPEELLIDFGLNPQPIGASAEPIPIAQRIITNLYTAKRLLYVLQQTIQRHEATFGALETDVQKRVRRA